MLGGERGWPERRREAAAGGRGLGLGLLHAVGNEIKKRRYGEREGVEGVLLGPLSVMGREAAAWQRGSSASATSCSYWQGRR